MKHLLSWAQSFAMAWGGPGLFVVALLDSSVLSLPEINDLLVILFVIQHKELMPYYAVMATLGSLAGCLLIYGIGRKGGDALLSRKGASARTIAVFQRYGLLTVLVPAMLPPPAPFKIFVLMAGVARVPVHTFTIAVVVGRGLRFLLVGLLAIRYGDAALIYLRENAKPAGLAAAAITLLAGLLYVYWSRRHGRGQVVGDQTAASDSSAS